MELIASMMVAGVRRELTVRGVENAYRGYSTLRTHTAVRSYGRARLRGIGPP